jgi:pSer/pThr/pTyr-binding forkhead associated (FHA) protein
MRLYVVTSSETISRYHAAIHRKGREVEIEELNSRNGTFVNDSAIRTIPLQPGDEIRLADVDLVYEQ